MRKSLLNFLASAALSFGLAGPVVAQEAIKIGQIEAQTGPSSYLGFMATQGAKLAVHQINQAGGVEVGGKKYPIDLDSPDTQGSPQQ
ncbi:MAG: branched-chain amino acid ABC transporter substrate-binding protein, partial [Gammaproteobacteria bacterium]